MAAGAEVAQAFPHFVVVLSDYADFRVAEKAATLRGVFH